MAIMSIVFVCHGNICRSPIAEFVLKEFLRKDNLLDKIEVISRAVSLEEIGNDIYPPAKKVLIKHNIPISKHKAQRISRQELISADFVFAMDFLNVNYLKRLYPDVNQDNVYLLLNNSEVSDPWYTGDFEKAYNDIEKGIKENLIKIKSLIK